MLALCNFLRLQNKIRKETINHFGRWDLALPASKRALSMRFNFVVLDIRLVMFEV